MVVDDVLAAQLDRLAGLVRVVLAGVDRDVDDRVRQAAHAGAVQSHGEGEPEVEPGRRLHDGQFRLDLVRDGQIPEPSEVERLELDRDCIAVLLARPKPEAAEREAGHFRPYK